MSSKKEDILKVLEKRSMMEDLQKHTPMEERQYLEAYKLFNGAMICRLDTWFVFYIQIGDHITYEGVTDRWGGMG